MSQHLQKRIVLADDHSMFRQGLRALLEREGYQIVGEAANGHEAVQQVKQFKPLLAILDFGMPLMNGIEAAREIYKRAPDTQVLLLTMFEDDAYVLEALRAGIRGYVLKAQAATDLINAIREVLSGSIYLSPGISEAVVKAYVTKQDQPGELLTDRERQVLQLVAEGYTTKKIGVFLGVSVKTAESHRTRIMQKLNIHDTAGLVRYAIRKGIIEA